MYTSVPSCLKHSAYLQEGKGYFLSVWIYQTVPHELRLVWYQA